MRWKWLIGSFLRGDIRPSNVWKELRARKLKHEFQIKKTQFNKEIEKWVKTRHVVAQAINIIFHSYAFFLLAQEFKTGAIESFYVVMIIYQVMLLAYLTCMFLTLSCYTRKFTRLAYDENRVKFQINYVTLAVMISLTISTLSASYSRRYDYSSW